MKLQTLRILATGIALAAVPAGAVELNLETATQGTINGAIFSTNLAQSTGTGVIDSFVRVQDNGIADGYNSSVRPVMPDVNTSPQFTRDLNLGEVPLVTIAGVVYREFLLDINQTSNNPKLSLDQILIYTRTTALTSADELSDLQSVGSTLRYNLDLGDASNRILLNYNLNNGSGSGDMFAYIPQSAFAGSTNGDFVYLYSSFGEKGGDYEENDGFEEWAVRTNVTTSVPDGGATAALLGLALGTVGFFRTKFGASRK